MRHLILLSAAAAMTATSFAVSVSPAEARQHMTKQQREWRGADGRMHCRRSNGTVGLVVGGVAGALVGRTIDTSGDRAVGTVVGAGAGALIGHRIARRRTCR